MPHRLLLPLAALLLVGCPDAVFHDAVRLAPRVDLGSDQAVDEGATVQLTGTAVDADGEPVEVSWRWQVESGPDIDFDDATAAAPTFVAPAVAVDTAVVFFATATTPTNLSGSDAVTVTIASLNAAPAVDAGDDQTVNEGDTVSLRGVATDDGAVVSLTRASPLLSLGEGGDVDFTAPQTTERITLHLELTAVDDDGAQGRDSVEVTVLPVNAVPTADAGEGQVVLEGEAVSLGGVADDPDGFVAAVVWEQLAGAPVALSGSDGDDASFTAPAPVDADTLAFRFTATDDEGATASDVTVVTVLPSNLPPTADAGADQAVDEATSVQLSGAAADPDGVVASITWSQLQGPSVTLADADTLAPTFNAPTLTAAATLLFELLVADDEGSLASDLVLISVLHVNAPPSADAGPDQNVDEQSPVALAGQASDSDGAIASIQWTQVDGPAVALADDDTLAPTFTAPTSPFGVTLEFTLTAFDDEGAAASDSVQITVEPLVVSNQPPSAWAGADRSEASGSTVTLDGVASDSDGSVAATTWLQVEGPAVTLSGDSTLQPSFPAPVLTCPAVFRFELTVIDDAGAVATDEVAVTIDGVGGATMAAGTLEDFEGDDGGFVTESALWEWGNLSSGPGVAWDGSHVWATNLDGAYPAGSQEWLCLPGLVGSGTLAMRVWADMNGGDGLRIEALQPGLGWARLDDVIPAYDRVLGGAGAWGNLRYLENYELVLARIPAWAGDPARVRLSFESDAYYAATGAYVDAVGWYPETADPDGDGLPGLADEFETHGTDPLLAGTDGDGASDGDEVAAGTNPLNPADWPGVTALVAGDPLDFEADDGGLAVGGALRSGGALWEHGEPTAGPTEPWSGARVWTTLLAGNPFAHADEHLYLPPIDLTGSADPALTFRLHARAGSGDGATVEARMPDGTWAATFPSTPAYDSDFGGVGAWQTQGYLGDWTFAVLPLDAFVGQRLELRIRYRSDTYYSANGVHIDDLGVFEETDDPDGDGLLGVDDEWTTYGTNPLLWDTEGDGAGDGDEVAAGSNPLNPADSPTAVMLVPGDSLDFEGDGGGLATAGGLWEWGSPAGDVSGGYSGGGAWGTNLDGNYFANADEWLELPLIDLTAATEPSLGLRVWLDCSSGDGLTLERWTGAGWVPIDVVPDYQTTSGSVPMLQDLNYRLEWAWLGADLSPWTGQVIRTRLAFHSDTYYGAYGAVMDDLVIAEETEDLDGDGIPGLLNEWSWAGTDPDIADTDGDGALDGDEVAAGTDPLNPADHPGAAVLTPGSRLDFTTGDGGLATRRELWEFGQPASGPGAAHSGSWVWATDLSGSPFSNADEPLYLPVIDLDSATEPTLSLRIWADTEAGDGTQPQVQSGDGSWLGLVPDHGPYDGTASGGAVWQVVDDGGGYALSAFDLSAWAGQLLRTRLHFTSNTYYTAPGIYVDDIALDEESSDPDNDGLLGVLAEAAIGTDPYVADTDGDGVDDGAEVTAGTDPLDPGSF